MGLKKVKSEVGFLGEQLDESLVLDNSVKNQKESIVFKLSKEELVEYKDEFYKLSALLDEKMEYMASVKEILMVDAETGEQIKEAIVELTDMADLSEIGIKELKRQISELLSIIRKEFVEKEVMVYYLPDYDNDTIYKYLKDGELIESKEMSLDDRQLYLKL